MASKARDRYDAVIVGTGPGGATCAREMARRGKKVLLLEWGGGAPVNGTLRQSVDMVGIPGKSLLFTPQGLAMARGVTVGGSSILYCATAFEPAHAMLKSRGVDIEREVAEAREELPLGPLDDRLMGPQALRLMESAQSLGFAWNKLDKYIDQEKCRARCDRCFLGCPHRAKWNARMFVEEAVALGSDLVVRARARKVLVENGKAVGVLYTKKGVEHRVFAPVVVVAAGGIGSPVLLRASGFENVGKRFFFDPLIVVFGSLRHFNAVGEVPMAAGAHFPEEGIMMTDMAMHPALYQGFTAQVGRLDRIMAYPNTLGIMIKIRDDLGGRLTDRGGVRKKLCRKDYARLSRGYERAREILEHAGARHIFKSWYIAAHPGGTAKLGEVVDANLETRVKNLFVCDCSVIPEAWGLPPTLTLIGLGKRLAGTLAGRLPAAAKKAA